jgi:hypothetical protein
MIPLVSEVAISAYTIELIYNMLTAEKQLLDIPSVVPKQPLDRCGIRKAE